MTLDPTEHNVFAISPVYTYRIIWTSENICPRMVDMRTVLLVAGPGL